MDSMLDSSMEELSPEQRLMLISSKRQEPQGEEHSTMEGGQKENPSLTTAAILHHLVTAGGGAGKAGPLTRTKTAKSPCSSSSDSSSDCSDCDDCDQLDSGFHHMATGSNASTNSRTGNSNRNSGGERNPNNASLDSSHSTYNTLIIHHNNSSLLADTWIPASHEFTSFGMGSSRNSACENPGKSQQGPAGSSGAIYSGSQLSHQQRGALDSLLSDGNATSSELSGIPQDYLEQLTVLKHLAKEVQQDPMCGSSSQLFRSSSFSRSQPDLTQTSILSSLPVGGSQDYDATRQVCKKKKHREITDTPAAGTAHNEDVLPSVQILEILMRENSNLKAELAGAKRKINTIHKLESELTRLQNQHSALFESAERRESLERTARAKLSTEVKRLTAVNRELLSSSNSLQNLSPFALSSDSDAYKKEISKKDLSISHFVAQNKELGATKERQEIELAAQRATLAEQRAHIDILDQALTNAQATVLRLEEDVRKKQEAGEKLVQVQRALAQQQHANEKREQNEKKVRAQLEGEITDLKLQLASLNANNSVVHSRCGGNNGGNMNNCRQAPPPYPGNNNQQTHDTSTELQLLQEKIRQSEDKIQHLSAQVIRWENFFSVEGDKTAAGSTPNTPNSWSSRGGTPHFFGGNGSGSSSTAGIPEDLSTTQNRAADLEWKVKDLESRLVEKDNMIRVLNQQNIPQATSPVSPMFSSFNSSSSSVPLGYRESPGYQSSMLAAGKLAPLTTTHPPIINHQVCGSLASIVDKSQGMMIMDPTLMYSKVTKCESEPPSYANLPLKMRLGGSGSSLAKNSNESLGSAGGLAGGAVSSNSGPGSVSSSGSNTKSIDEQLKDLDHQLLSKGGSGLKVQSGLCCIPGFSHPGTASRKGKIPQSLLESLSHGNSSNTTNVSNQSHVANNPPYKKSAVLPPLPKPPVQTSMSQMQPNNQQQTRTSSGPPFMSPSILPSTVMNMPPSTALSLSNSVDSVLSESSKIMSCNNALPSGANVFTPVSALPKGLPPKGPTLPEVGKCRSLEREQRGKMLESGKYSALMYDSSRCRSLDRREIKAQTKLEEKAKEKEEKEKKAQKSSVGSKAAFFGNLLTRRSPSPSRSKDKDKDKEKEKEKEKSIDSGQKVARFPFSRVQHPPTSNSQKEQQQDSDQEIDTAFLDKQGRSSQRNRISKWSHSNLEAVQEQSSSGGESPWVQRRSGGSLLGKDYDTRTQFQNLRQATFDNNKSPESCSNNNNNDGDCKKWGKIVKTPFGLRYTFGSPRIAETIGSSKAGSNSKGVDVNKDGRF